VSLRAKELQTPFIHNAQRMRSPGICHDHIQTCTVTCGWKSAKGPCMDRTRRAVSLY